MADYLHTMGIQRWQRRNDTEVHRRSNISVDEKKVILNTESNVNVDIDSSETLSAYAATSLRYNEQGQQCRWLWVLPQPSLTSDELQLIDKMIAATGASWELSSIADSYLEENKLDDVLNQSLNVVIFFASSLNWPAFEKHVLFNQEKFIYTNSTNHLLTHPQEKRLVWQKLQRLMAL